MKSMHWPRVDGTPVGNFEIVARHVEGYGFVGILRLFTSDGSPGAEFGRTEFYPTPGAAVSAAAAALERQQ